MKTLTVGELRAALSKAPDDTKVLVDDLMDTYAPEGRAVTANLDTNGREKFFLICAVWGGTEE